MGRASSNFYNTYSASITQSNKSLICRVRAAVALNSFLGNCEIQHQRRRCISNDTRLLRQTDSDTMSAFRWRSRSISIPPRDKVRLSRNVKSHSVPLEQNNQTSTIPSRQSAATMNGRTYIYYRASQPRKMIDSPR